MSGTPPKVTPASVLAADFSALAGTKTATVTQAWALLQGALGYWLPHGLNQGIVNAKAAGRKR